MQAIGANPGKRFTDSVRTIVDLGPNVVETGEAQIKLHGPSAEEAELIQRSLAKERTVVVDLKNFGQTLQQIEAGHKRPVVREMLRHLQALLPKLTEARKDFEAKNELRHSMFDTDEKSGQGDIALDNGVTGHFIYGRSGETVSYGLDDDTKEPFGYITVDLKDGSIKSADMWTPKAVRESRESYHRIGIVGKGNNQFELQTQKLVNDDKEREAQALQWARDYASGIKAIDKLGATLGVAA